MLFCGLFLLFCCSEDEIQRARLIDAFGYDRDTFRRSWLPLPGSGVIKTSTIIELVFDKPVLEVSINYSAKAEPNEMPPTTIWTLESNRLEDVWIHRAGMNSARDVTLMVIYEDEAGIYKETLDVTLDLQSNSPRVIAVDPQPGARRSEPVELGVSTQEFRITFNEPIIPNSGSVLFGSSRIQLQETEPTDVITWNQCYRRFRFLEPDDTGEPINAGSLVISDFQNVNYDVQPHAFVGWYRMPLGADIASPQALEYYPSGGEIDPEITREIRVVFSRPMEEKAILDISPPIEVVFMGIENERIRFC